MTSTRRSASPGARGAHKVQGRPSRRTLSALERTRAFVRSLDESGYWAEWPYLLGFCIVCGQETAFFAEPESVPRESLLCGRCISTSRYRSIARGVLETLAALGVNARSVAELSRHRSARRVSIFDTQTSFSYPPYTAYLIPDLLAGVPWIDLECSRYRPGMRRGDQLGDHVTNQDLEHLTYADKSFDIVITTDVLEHVRLDQQAFAEIARVLKPGGVLLMTVPHTRGQHDTITKVVVHDQARPELDEVIGEPELHGSADPEEQDGVLSYRTYGTDVDERLSSLGFQVEYDCVDRTELGIIGTELFSCRMS